MRFPGLAVFAVAGAFALAGGGCSILRHKTAPPASPPRAPQAKIASGTGAPAGPAISAAAVASAPDAEHNLAAAFAASGQPGRSGLTIDRVVATVDGNPVTMEDVEGFSAAAGKPLPEQPGAARDLAIRKALKGVIEERMLEDEVKKYSGKIDDRQVDGYIRSIKQRSGMNDQQFNAELRRHGMTPATFRKYARVQLERAEMIQTEVRSKINISQAQIEAYYREHPDKFMVKHERVRLAQILVAVPPGAPPAQVATARAKAESIRKRALKGEDFGALAAQYSDDSSKSKGGELGYFQPGNLMDQIAAAIKPLKPGGISQVVRSSHGFHILKLEARELPGVQPLAEVSDQIRNHLLDLETQKQFHTWVDRDLIKEHYVESLY